MRFIIIVFLVVCSINSLFAQNNSSDLLNIVQEKYNNISDLSANFSQTANSGNSASGKFYYKKDKMLRIEFKNLTIITNGKTTWNYNKKENKVIISTYDDSDPFALSLNKLIYDYPKNSVVKDVSKNNQKILQLIPKDGESDFKNITIWVKDDNLINRVIFEDAASNKSDITISGYNLNSGLNDSKFSFTAPEGSTVIDLR